MLLHTIPIPIPIPTIPYNQILIPSYPIYPYPLDPFYKLAAILSYNISSISLNFLETPVPSNLTLMITCTIQYY